MKIINYFLKDFKFIIYLFGALILSLLFGVMTNTGCIGFYRLLLPVFCILFILRLNDDINDYEKDKERKKQYLSKKQLVLTEIFLCCIFLFTNIFLFKLKGIYAVFIVIYILLLEIQLIDIIHIYHKPVFLYY